MASAGRDSDSLLTDVRPASAGPPRQWWRRAGLAVLLAVVVLGAFGVFGVHSRSTSATSNGYTLAVTYPQSARAGLDVPFRVSVHHAGGIDDDLTLAISTDYFRMFETQGFYPDASSSTNDGRFVYLTFSKPPSGDDFLMDFDAYIQPGSQLGKSATVKLIVQGHELARTSIRTWLVP
ncbi:MAG TPA: hypothetical protein VGL39_26885 [Jatrophihabitantaceae bacterium]|jgi:hypothetical protein